MDKHWQRELTLQLKCMYCTWAQMVKERDWVLKPLLLLVWFCTDGVKHSSKEPFAHWAVKVNCDACGRSWTVTFCVVHADSDGSKESRDSWEYRPFCEKEKRCRYATILLTPQARGDHWHLQKETEGPKIVVAIRKHQALCVKVLPRQLDDRSRSLEERWSAECSHPLPTQSHCSFSPNLNSERCAKRKWQF